MRQTANGAHILRKLQRGLAAIQTWCEHWNIKVNEDKTQAIYSSPRPRPPEAHLTLNGRNIPFVNHVKYPGVILDKRITWRLYIGMIEAKAFRTFVRIYSLFKSECLRANIKLTLHKALMRCIMTYACPAWELAAPTKQVSSHQRRNSKLHTGPRCAHSFQPSINTRLYNKIVQVTSRNYTNS
jgi:hypothetical protein